MATLVNEGDTRRVLRAKREEPLILPGFVGQPFRVAYFFSKAKALPYKSLWIQRGRATL